MLENSRMINIFAKNKTSVILFLFYSGKLNTFQNRIQSIFLDV